MLSSAAEYSQQIVRGLQDGILTVFPQEFLFLVVFFASFSVWRRLNQQSKRRRLNGGSSSSKQESDDVAEVIKGSRRSSADSDTSSDSQSSRRYPEDGVRSRKDVARSTEDSAKAAEETILAHLDRREFTRALNLYRSWERNGQEGHFSEEIYLALLQSAVRVSKPDVVEKLLYAMHRTGRVPSVKFFQNSLRMLSSRKHFNLCLIIQSLFQEHMPDDRVILSCIINAALDLNVPHRAVELLERYRGCDVQVPEYVLCFRVYAAVRDIDAAEALFRKLGSSVTSLMFNIVLQICTAMGQPQRGCDLFHEAAEIERSSGNSILDVVSHNTVIKGLAQARATAQCLEVFHSMTVRGLQPDEITFTTLLDLCTATGDSVTASKVVSYLVEAECAMDTILCTMFIKGLVKADCSEQALELCKEMKTKKGTQPDLVTYTILVKALVDKHDLEGALKLVADMVADGCTPDDMVLTHLLEGCRYAGKHELGLELFTKLVEKGLKPSDVTLVTILKLLGRCGAHRKAHDLVKSWEANHHWSPSVVHYTCLMSGCLRSKSYDLAWEAYEMMRLHNVSPDSTTISTLLPGMVAAQRWDNVVALAQDGAALYYRGLLRPDGLQNALAQMRASGERSSRQTYELESIMRSAGIPCGYANGSMRYWK